MSPQSRIATTMDEPLDDVLGRISAHPLVDGILLVGSTGSEALAPDSDYDLLVVLSGLPAPLRIVNTWVDHRLTEAYITTTAAIERILNTSMPLPDGSEEAGILRWLREGHIAHDRRGILHTACEKAPTLQEPALPGDREIHEAWRKIGYNLAQMRRYLAAGDDISRLTVDMRLLYSVDEVKMHYFTVRKLAWRGEKAAIRYWSEHDPDFLALLRDYFGAADQHARVDLYASLAESALAPVGQPWQFGETIVSVGAGWGTGGEAIVGTEAEALALWEDIAGR